MVTEALSVKVQKLKAAKCIYVDKGDLLYEKMVSGLFLKHYKTGVQSGMNLLCKVILENTP